MHNLVHGPLPVRVIAKPVPVSLRDAADRSGAWIERRAHPHSLQVSCCLSQHSTQEKKTSIQFSPLPTATTYVKADVEYVGERLSRTATVTTCTLQGKSTQEEERCVHQSPTRGRALAVTVAIESVQEACIAPTVLHDLSHSAPRVHARWTRAGAYEYFISRKTVGTMGVSSVAPPPSARAKAHILRIQKLRLLCAPLLLLPIRPRCPPQAGHQFPLHKSHGELQWSLACLVGALQTNREFSTSMTGTRDEGTHTLWRAGADGWTLQMAPLELRHQSRLEILHASVVLERPKNCRL